MTGVREFLNTTAGRVVAIALMAVALLVSGFVIWNSVGASEAARLSRDRLFICSETGKQFECELKAGMSIPTRSPYSGKETGYPAELCFWTKDGKTKSEPTAVLLNRWVGKPGPTFCSDCGRLVVGHNPAPGPDVRVPPTQAEYRPRGDER
jgi:hypothetical protein